MLLTNVHNTLNTKNRDRRKFEDGLNRNRRYETGNYGISRFPTFS